MSRLPLVLLMMLALALTACQVGPDPDTAPYGLQTEGAVASPLLNAGPPRFNWKMKPFEHLRGTRQSAYQLLVASSPALLRPGKADVWDSGQILSDQSVWVSYQGPALRSEQQYFWTVRVWDEQNGMSAWADPAHWYTGLEDWSAQWIGAEASGLALGKKGDDDVYIAPVATCLRRQIEIGEGLESAVLYATGVGAYVCQVDGERVGEKLLTPGWTDYPDRIMYQRYDITRQLTSGPHFLSATLGNAWWSSGLGWKGADVYSEGPLRFSATLVLTYADGKVERILTDPSWESTLAPHHVNTLYHGEHFDAGMELTGWQASSVHEAPSKQIVPQYGPDIIITDRLKPVSVTEVGPDTFIFDLGQNMVGRARLFVDGPAGTAVQLRFAEILKPDGRIYTENLRSARATDRYTLAGNGPENWAPEFTYHGFRYVEVTGFPGKPTTDAIVGEVFHSNLPKTFAFSSSNPLIDTLVRNIDWGLRGNVHSVPTDCPQRDERLGWTGDAQAFLPTASHMRYSYDFFRKWMQDIRDSQDSSGYVPDVNPVIVVNGPGKPGWADAVVVVPWQLFRYYGDTAILRENYAAMQAWVEYMNRERKEDYYYFANEKGDWFGYGDWVAPEASPGKPIGAAYHYYSTHLLGKIAETLGYAEDAETYTFRAKGIAEAFQRDFFDQEEYQYEGGTQTAHLLPLAFGITPEKLAPSMARNVAGDVLTRGAHLNTGFLGTPFLLPKLSDYGQHELAYQVINQTDYPSWGYMIEKGATTIWELWDSDQKGPQMNSRNHFALGTVGEWIFGYLGGIRPGSKAGFKEAHLAPMPAEGLAHVQYTYESPYGTYFVGWEKRGEELEIQVTIPPNATAVLDIPVSDPTRANLREGETRMFVGGKPQTLPAFVELEGVTEKVIRLKVAAGQYVFSLRES